MNKRLILAINPGSTSTKIALYEEEKELFSTNISMTPEMLADFQTINDSYDFRKEMIVREVEKHGYHMQDIGYYACRGGKMVPTEGGVFRINQKMLDDGPLDQPVPHPLLLSPHFGNDFAKTYGGEAFTLNQQRTDEYSDLARMTGLHDVFRQSAIHTLNHKEVGARAAAKLGKRYDEAELIIAHLGGGISLAAHHKGRMIDGTHSGYGDGPMATSRSGSLTVYTVLEMAYSGQFTFAELGKRVAQTGGLLDHLGTVDAQEVERRIANGDAYAKLVYDTMLYQICKHIGSMAAVLEGKTEAIVLTGGMANSTYVVEEIRRRTGWIAPIMVMAGEYEMEALALGVLRALRGEEEIKEYTGKPVFTPEEFLAKYGVEVHPEDKFYY